MSGLPGPARVKSDAASPAVRQFLTSVRAVIAELSVVVRNTHFYALSNEVFEEPLRRLLAALAEIAEQEQVLALELVGQELFANGVRVRMELRSLHRYSHLVGELKQRGLGGVELDTQVSRQDLLGFLSVFAARGLGGEDAAAELNRRLADAGVGAIWALPTRDEAAAPGPAHDQSRRRRALDVYQQTLDFIRKSFLELDSPAQLDRRRAKRLIQKLVDLSYEEGEGFSLIGLASIKSHDHYTFNHMVNVCILAVAFGQRLGLSRRQLAELGLCALYHDIGKLHVPLEVLNKPGRLTEEEWALMGNHTVYAGRTLFPQLARDPKLVMPVLTAVTHHFGHAGLGYPKLRILTRQTLHARIVAIVDAYDAMTTKRVYQDECLPDEALRRLLADAGRYSDPVLIKAFINCVGIYPVGSTVELLTGELGVVVQASSDPERLDLPWVRVVTDAGQDGSSAPLLVDLSKPAEAGRRILRCVSPEVYGINAAHYAI